MATATQIRDAMNMLSARAQGVLSAEAMEKRQADQHREASAKLLEAQRLYDEALEAAIEVFPQVAKGYNLNPETVGIGPDGQVHVLPAEEAS